jgi:hypothetical protein
LTLYNSKGASEYFTKKGFSFAEGTLIVWRSGGKGPRFIRLKGKIRYREKDLDEFLDLHEILETTDTKKDGY